MWPDCASRGKGVVEGIVQEFLSADACDRKVRGARLELIR